MKKSRPLRGGGARMVHRSSSLDNLGMDNKKLEEDVALMEASLHHHRNKMMQQDLAVRTQISKATGSSRWQTGGKGQLAGYRSHKDLQNKNGNQGERPVKSRPTSSKHTQQRENDAKARNRTRGKMDAYSQHGIQNSSTKHHIDLEIHADEIHPGSRRRSSANNTGILCNSSPEQKITGQKKEGNARRVSFDLSDEDGVDEDDDVIVRRRKTTAELEIDALHLPLYGLDKQGRVLPSDLNSDRIASLKAKVIAKASAAVDPENSKAKIQTKRGLQAKKSRNVVSNKARDDKRRAGTQNEKKKQNTAKETTLQLSATGTEMQRISKLNSNHEKHRVDIDTSPTHTQIKWEGLYESDSDHELDQKSSSHSPHDSSPTHTHVKWEGYESDPEDEFDQKSSSHSSSDVFLAEPTLNNLSRDDISRGRQTLVHDPAVTAWLYSLDLLDPEKYSQIFHGHAIAMETVPVLTENQLKAIGVTSFAALQKILKGIKQLSGGKEPQTHKSKKMTVHNSESETSRKSTHSERLDNLLGIESVRVSKQDVIKNKNLLGEVSVDQSGNTLNLQDGQNGKTVGVPGTGRKTDNPKLSSSRRDGEATKKKSCPLSADVVNRTLASGVQAASYKLKKKQKYEMQELKRLDKLKQLKKAERDRMAQQHSQRTKEREERKQREEEEERIVGYGDGETSESLSPTQTVSIEISDLHVLSQGLPSHQAEQQIAKPKSSKVSSRVDNQQPGKSSESSDTLFSEQKLLDLELEVSGLQAASSHDTTDTEAKLARIQQQLTSLQQQLRPNSAKTRTNKSNIEADSQKARAVSAPGKRRTRTQSISKQDLMSEVRKQKEKHRKEIRVLESELSRLRYRDPVKSCELPEEDIVFDETAVIGEGAFSLVYSGNFNGSEVAIKRLKIPILEADHNYFAEEVSLLHELRHPRVVLLLGVSTSGRLPLMVLEYMAGGSLYDYLHDSNRSSLDHVGYYQIARDICLGMNYLHRHRPVVIHLDLKSMNVLLGAYSRAKIADFGFSKLRHEAGTGKVKGTPAWMAPELLENTGGDLTTKVDVYSFAIILWEMLTRNTPYEGLSVYQILERVRQKKRPQIPESCPDHLRKLICNCWEHKPNKRPSFKDILIGLEGLSFPPEWKALLSAAGIPRETMEDPTSARSIITLVNQSINMSQRELDQMALESHMEMMKASQMEDVAEEEAAGERVGLHSDLVRDVLDQMEDVRGIQHPTMEDSGYDDDTALSKRSAEGASSGQAESRGRSGTSHQSVPVAPPPPPLSTSTTNPNPSQLIVQARTLRKASVHSKQTGQFHSPRGDQPQFQLDANALTEQREHLRNTTEGQHPSQLADLGRASEARLLSIADILKKAVNSRRAAFQEDLQSREDLQQDGLWSMDSPR